MRWKKSFDLLVLHVGQNFMCCSELENIFAQIFGLLLRDPLTNSKTHRVAMINEFSENMCWEMFEIFRRSNLIV